MSEKNLLKTMDEESEELESIFIGYTLGRKSNDENVYCFFEGDDYQYYCSKVNMYLEDREKIKIFNCDGKDNVLTIYGMIKDRTKDIGDKKLFFIDKDFDKNIVQNEEIYTTPCYAIENFYITDRFIENFFIGEFKINENSKEIDKNDFQRGINFYKEQRENFIKRVTLLNVWYSLQENKAKYCNDVTGFPDLKRLKELKDLQFPITIDYLKSMTSNYIEITELEFENEKIRLLKDPVKNFRGKYFLEFLFEIITILTSDKAKNKGIFYKKRKASFSIGKSNVVSLLSQYAEVPKCLKEYLQNMLVHKTIDTIDNIG
ncbi:DUF4435 domain-containing protein [Clostridium beijerinckii]|uniref:DUF4435 domain-containing protein n=1 Tax=Clostridium beijerinckii TaxID=1520 RepID=UPI0002FC1C83|nr:DUF4435 domain-containing protein [Clostridium beijerinckii]